ncbi:MAG: hypothetical protein KDI09_12260 [Halioglobus sp.]|nr:hypothetical protein [Halioglobus sp.]
MKLLFATLTAAMLYGFSFASLAQTMNFENFPATAVCPDGASGVTQNGLRISDNTPSPPAEPDSCVLGANNDFPPPGGPGVPTNGSSVLGWCGACAPQSLTLTLERQDSAPFNLVSIDFSRFPNMGTGTVNITGFPAGGGTPVTVQHTINADTWVTVNFNALSNVERVEIVHDSYPNIDSLLDNIVTSAVASNTSAAPVPVMGPALLWLLGMLTVLVAAAGLRKRR